MFLSRHTNEGDLEAFTFLYPLADAALVRKMERTGITQDRLEFVSKAVRAGVLRGDVYATYLGDSPREDFVPYVADFLLELDEVKWSVVSGRVGHDVIISVRNLGHSRNAGEFVKTYFFTVSKNFKFMNLFVIKTKSII